MHPVVIARDVLLELRRTPAQPRQAFVVRGRQPGNDAAHAADRLVDDAAVPVLEPADCRCVGGDDGLGHREAVGTNEARLVGLGTVARHRRVSVDDQDRRDLCPGGEGVDNGMSVRKRRAVVRQVAQAGKLVEAVQAHIHRADSRKIQRPAAELQRACDPVADMQPDRRVRQVALVEEHHRLAQVLERGVDLRDRCVTGKSPRRIMRMQASLRRNGTIGPPTATARCILPRGGRC